MTAPMILLTLIFLIIIIDLIATMLTYKYNKDEIIDIKHTYDNKLNAMRCKFKQDIKYIEGTFSRKVSMLDTELKRLSYNRPKRKPSQKD